MEPKEHIQTKHMTAAANQVEATVSNTEDLKGNVSQTFRNVPGSVVIMILISVFKCMTLTLMMSLSAVHFHIMGLSEFLGLSLSNLPAPAYPIALQPQ